MVTNSTNLCVAIRDVTCCVSSESDYRAKFCFTCAFSTLTWPHLECELYKTLLSFVCYRRKYWCKFFYQEVGSSTKLHFVPLVVKIVPPILFDFFSTMNASNDEPKPSSDVENKDDEDSSWIEAMHDELLQFELQKGYTQEEGIDYDEVFALVAKIEEIMLFLDYASFKDFVVYQMDVNSAFMYAKIKEEVYVCQPPGFEDPEFPNKVYKVEKTFISVLLVLDMLYPKVLVKGRLIVLICSRLCINNAWNKMEQQLRMKFKLVLLVNAAMLLVAFNIVVKIKNGRAT
ncbi:putative ribonuclease H-like domain-containing protein [Tanacetum coccineum]